MCSEPKQVQKIGGLISSHGNLTIHVSINQKSTIPWMPTCLREPFWMSENHYFQHHITSKFEINCWFCFPIIVDVIYDKKITKKKNETIIDKNRMTKFHPKHETLDENRKNNFQQRWKINGAYLWGRELRTLKRT